MSINPNINLTLDDRAESPIFEIGSDQIAPAENGAPISDDRVLSITRINGLPKPENENQPSTNPDAINRQTELRTNNAITGKNLSSNSEMGAQYGKVTVTETEGGHMIVLNDTLGSERVLLRHSNGSGIEFRPDGSILISATNIIFDVEGDMDFAGTGNINYYNRGDVKFDAGGKISLSSTGFSNEVKGNVVENIHGRKDVAIRGNQNTMVRGSNIETYVGEQVITNLSSVQQNIKGNMTLRIDGDGGIYSSGNLGITAETRAYMSSPSLAINANNLQVIGATGTIGGEGIINYSYNSYVGHTLNAGDTIETQAVHANRVNGISMHASTFHGDLNGTAADAVGTAVSYTNTTQTDVSENTSATFEASTAIANARLQTLLNGVKKVQVDPGNYIRNSIDRSYSTSS